MNKTWGAIVHAELSDVVLDIMGPEDYLWRDEEAPLGGEMAFS